MTPEELGQKFKAQFPAYSQFPDEVVGRRALAMHPEYEQLMTNNAEQIEPGVYGETSPAGQKILENLGMVAGGYGVGNLIGTGLAKAAESKLGRALLNSPQDIGVKMREGLTEAGVARRPPELGPSAKFENPYQYPSELPQPAYKKGIAGIPVNAKSIPRLKPQIPAEPLPTSVPLKYPEDPASFHNFADARIQGFGNKLTPQEVNDYKTILSDKLTTMERGGLSGTPLYSDLSSLKSRVSQLHESLIPGREELNQIYGLSKGIRSAPGKVWSGAKKAAKIGATTAVIGKYLSQ